MASNQLPIGPSPYTSFAQPYSPPSSPVGGSNSPYAGAPAGFNQQQFEQQLMTSPDLAGIWDAIQKKGTDIWDGLKDFLPKNADGSVDWGKVGGDLLGFVKSAAPTIIQGLSALNQYNRQQQSDKYAQKGLDLATEQFGLNQPLRDAGRAGLLSAGAYKPDLTKLNALAGSGYSGPGSTLPMATQKPAPGTLPISAGPPAPTPTPTGGAPKIPVPGQSQFGSQFQGPASQLPQPAPGAPSGMVPGIGAGGPLMPKPGTLPISAGPPNPLLKPQPNGQTLPFATGYQ